MPHPDGYFALVLSPESASDLRDRFATLQTPIAHHCTVRHGTSDPADLPDIFGPDDVGRSFGLLVTGFATRADGGVQAAVVSLVLADGTRLDRGFSSNVIPHVTVATDGTTEPVEANALLEAGFEAVEEALFLTATLAHVRP